MPLALIPLIVIAGFLAGSMVSMQILRWIVLLQATTASQSGDFIKGTRRRLLWSTPLIALLHPAPYLLAASITATILCIAGWHTHPGVILTTVVSGSIEWYDGRCQKQIYNAGDSLTETDKLHYVRNVGAANARLMINFVIAKGQPRKIDQPAPSCAIALGLI